MTDQLVLCANCRTDCGRQHWYCDEVPTDGPWCPACFDETPCGRGEHDEGCPTLVVSLGEEASP